MRTAVPPVPAGVILLLSCNLIAQGVKMKEAILWLIIADSPGDTDSLNYK